jgi:hypothetical protein
MKKAKIVHWIALALLAYCGVGSIAAARHEMAYQFAFAIALWTFLWVMLYRRPRTWGLGIGVFLLVVIGLQLGLWRLALTKKEEYQVDDSWLNFTLSIVPLFITACCSISLRWLHREEPNQTPEPTTLTVTPRAPSSTSRAGQGRGSS